MATAAPTRSTTIALTADEMRLVVVNREANTLSVIRVKDDNGNDVATKLAEIGVGIEPRCVAVSPDDQLAFVTNGASGTVTVVNLIQSRVVQSITVGTEPRGCALTSDGSVLYVANHTDGTVSIISTAVLQVVGTVKVGRNPTAIAITDKGTASISDDTVFVTEILLS
jgi:YVTN family beta-propeller protein